MIDNVSGITSSIHLLSAVTPPSLSKQISVQKNAWLHLQSIMGKAKIPIDASTMTPIAPIFWGNWYFKTRTIT
jgi:hypothetical protein